MQPSQVMAQPSVFTLHSRHICFVYNMVGIINKTLIDFVPIGDVKVAMPTMDDLPQEFEGFGRAITQYPSKDAW